METELQNFVVVTPRSINVTFHYWISVPIMQMQADLTLPAALLSLRFDRTSRLSAMQGRVICMYCQLMSEEISVCLF
jgi:hypothetical protein